MLRHHAICTLFPSTTLLRFLLLLCKHRRRDYQITRRQKSPAQRETALDFTSPVESRQGGSAAPRAMPKEASAAGSAAILKTSSKGLLDPPFHRGQGCPVQGFDCFSGNSFPTASRCATLG